MSSILEEQFIKALKVLSTRDENLANNIIETDNNSSNQLLDSIMSGLKDINGPIILTYGDILFNDKIISELINKYGLIVNGFILVGPLPTSSP